MLFRRIGAYIIDIIIITLVIAVVGMFLPNNSKADEKIVEEVKSVIKGEKTTDEDVQKIKDAAYDMAKGGIVTSLMTIVVYFLYFVIVPLYNSGQTPGKMLAKIRIKSKKDKLSLWQLTLRGVFIYSYLFSLIDVLLLVTLSKNSYFSIGGALSYVQSILLFICFLMILFNGGIGLHDLVSSTVVVMDVEEGEVEVSNVSKWKEKEKTSTKKGINSERVKNHTKRKGE